MEGSIEKFNNLDREINEASELELADKLRGEKESSGEKYQIEIKGELIDLFEENYFSTMSKIDELSGNISDEDFKDRFGFDMSRLRKYVDGKIPDIMGRINIMSKRGEIFIEGNNSIRDILSNSLFGGLATVEWFKKNINNNSESIQDKINDPKSLRRKSLESARKLLESEDLEYYFNELCSSEDRLKMEAEFEFGFISRFSNFFKEDEFGKIYPSGSKKLSYFRFFSELEKGNISSDDLEDELDKLGEEFIDKGRIKNSDLIK